MLYHNAPFIDKRRELSLQENRVLNFQFLRITEQDVANFMYQSASVDFNRHLNVGIATKVLFAQILISSDSLSGLT